MFSDEYSFVRGKNQTKQNCKKNPQNWAPLLHFHSQKEAIVEFAIKSSRLSLCHVNIYTQMDEFMSLFFSFKQKRYLILYMVLKFFSPI